MCRAGIPPSLPLDGGHLSYLLGNLEPMFHQPVSIWTVIKAEGLPDCNRRHGTLGEEGTSFQRAGSQSAEGGCQGSGGFRVLTTLHITWPTQDPPLWQAPLPSQTRGQFGGLSGEAAAWL